MPLFMIFLNPAAKAAKRRGKRAFGRSLFHWKPIGVEDHLFCRKFRNALTCSSRKGALTVRLRRPPSFSCFLP